jgi:hypothetical protein
MNRNATLTDLGVSLITVVRHVCEMIARDADESAVLEHVSECYDGAGDLTYLQAANAAARFATNGVVCDVSGLILGYEVTPARPHSRA